MHKGVRSDEIPTAGIIEKLEALLAAVKLIARQIAVPNAAISPRARIFSVFEDPNEIIPIPISAPKIVSIILYVIFSLRKILLTIAAKIGDVLIIKRALAMDVNSIAITKNNVPNECEIININPLNFGALRKEIVGFL